VSRGEPARETVAFWTYRSMAWLGAVLPTSAGRRLFMALGAAAYATMPEVRARVAANQARVLGREPSDPLVAAATREAFRLYARYWFDTFDAIGRDDAWVLERFEFVNPTLITDLLAGGRGVVVALTHSGNWDLAGWAGRLVLGAPVVSVAERLKPERLFHLFLEHRRSLGLEIVALDSDSVGRRLAKAVESGCVVALVADRDLTGRGVEVSMFGASRRLPTGPALLALSTGAPLVVATVTTTPRGWRCHFSDPLVAPLTGNRRTDATALTLALAKGLEEAIAAAPPDWHMFQPGWE
jgi:KDO2-lipid IV(A) lauroyltransferase